MTTAADPQIVPRPPAAAPALRAADRGVASALEAVLSDNTRRVYGAQWRLFADWCAEMGLRSLPAEPLTVARYLAARAGTGAITKAHEWAGHESPCRDQRVRASLKGRGRRLVKPQRQTGALTAVQRGKFDVALAATTMEATVDSVLFLLLEAGQPFDYGEVRRAQGVRGAAADRTHGAGPENLRTACWRAVWPRRGCAHDGQCHHAGPHRSAVRPIQAAHHGRPVGGSFHRRWTRRCPGNFPGGTGAGS